MNSGHLKLRGCWGIVEISSFLSEATIPMRLAVQDSAASPWVVSLWFLYDDNAFWCATNRNAKLASYLQAHPQCGFEIAGDRPPYRGIRGKGKASVLPEKGEEILLRLLHRYGIPLESTLARSLLAKADQEVAIAIRPGRISSWDFTDRMADAV